MIYTTLSKQRDVFIQKAKISETDSKLTAMRAQPLDKRIFKGTVTLYA